MTPLIHADPPAIVPYTSIPDGLPYTQLFQHYPFLEPLYLPFEKQFSSARSLAFARATWPAVPLALCAAYALMIVLGTRYMKDKDKLTWKAPLACWNLTLSLFSLCGMMRTVPHLLHNVATLPLKDTICRHPVEAYGEGACGLWVMLFIFSKVPELVDTVFIVFRKSKLHFLHWYHHITVLLFCWHSYAIMSSTGLYFVAMNYSVHAVMYGYYYLMAVKAWPKWIPASLITVAQISQMVVGTAVCVASYHYLRTDPSCHVTRDNVMSGALMYGSYLYLFTDFFVRRYVLKQPMKAAAAAAAASPSTPEPAAVAAKPATADTQTQTDASSPKKGTNQRWMHSQGWRGGAAVTATPPSHGQASRRPAAPASSSPAYVKP